MFTRKPRVLLASVQILLTCGFHLISLGIPLCDCGGDEKRICKCLCLSEFASLSLLQDDNEPATNGALDDDIDLSSADSSPKRISGTANYDNLCHRL